MFNILPNAVGKKMSSRISECYGCGLAVSTVINASEAKIGAVDRSPDDDDLPVLYHESCFQ
jgi:hypothetical protein